MIFPFQSTLRRAASALATGAIASSVTQIQMTSAEKLTCASVTALAPDARATIFPRRSDAGLSRTAISSIRYPARFNAGARTLPTLPAPMIEMEGFFAMDAVENNRVSLSRSCVVYSFADEEEDASASHLEQDCLQRAHF